MWERARQQKGQASVEWVALLLVVALLAAAALAAGVRPPGRALAESLAQRLVCAVRLAAGCDRDAALFAAYGEELARLLRRHAPSIAYEEGMRALPVDFRRCRAPACSDGAAAGRVWRSHAGEPVTAFVHVVDCRPAGACGAGRAGSLYLQYWLYYPDSATLRGVPVAGSRGYHADDWESLQVRLRGADVDARASSHHGYNYGGGAANWGSDAGFAPAARAAELAGLRSEGGWGPATGWLFVSGGSHAGSASGAAAAAVRTTPRSRLRLVPLEPLARGAPRFAVTPPWAKEVWRDPEAEKTS